MFGNHRHALYSLIWIFSVIELGLTAYRIHKTRQAGYHEPIVAELLSVSIFTLLWIPIASLLIRRATSATGNAGQTSTMHHHGETIGNAIIWLMWLVGAAIATHKYPTRLFAGPGKLGRVLLTLIAFAWMIFGLLTLAKMFSAMGYAARGAGGNSTVVAGNVGGNRFSRSEKVEAPYNNTTAAPHTTSTTVPPNNV